LQDDQPHKRKRLRIMPGPSPIYRPDLPVAFMEQAWRIAQQRTVAYQLRQRAMLVLLLHADPLLSNVQAAAEVPLHPNAVRYWRRRWAQAAFVLEDAPGRGRKARFAPAGPRPRQSRRV
jgi:hypothetical protein